MDSIHLVDISTCQLVFFSYIYIDNDWCWFCDCIVGHLIITSYHHHHYRWMDKLAKKKCETVCVCRLLHTHTYSHIKWVNINLLHMCDWNNNGSIFNSISKKKIIIINDYYYAVIIILRIIESISIDYGHY